MEIGIPKERSAGEHRVAIVPAHLKSLIDAGCSITVEKGAGEASGYLDAEYESRGATLVGDLRTRADILLGVRAGAASTTDPGPGRDGQVIIAFLDPYQPHESFASYLRRNASTLAMELMPRITRAQAMDALSSMANLAGYRATILAAEALPRMFPMMMTAAGTIVPAKVLVIGVGVAGLQAIATARRLGGVVSAYDVRPAVKDQVLSLGARFVEMELDTADSESTGGYARSMDEKFYERQRVLMETVVAESNVVITTAAIPGKPSPVLVTEQMVAGMHHGSVIVDLAAERGGNCELTRPGETVIRHGVTIIGPTNVASSLAFTASQLYSKNITTFLLSMLRDGELVIDLDDEITAATLVTHAGAVPNTELRERLGVTE
jgi:NAD(P) transhydrogenase subunit alpha